jgi:hypothetical protein
MSSDTSNLNHQPFQRSITIAFLMLIVVSLCLFAALAFFSARQDLQENFDTLLKQTETNIVKAVQLADVGYEVLEISLDDRMRRGFEPFLAAYKQAGGDPNKIDLQALQKTLGDGIDLYIIDSKGVVTHTTYVTDIGLNLTQWPEFYKGIEQIRQKGVYTGDRITTETRTGNLRKFAYLATPDKKYILELGLKASEFKASMAKLDQITIAQQLKSFNPFLRDVRIFDSKAVLLGKPDFKPDSSLTDIVRRVYEKAEPHEIAENQYITRYIKADLQKPEQTHDTSLIIELSYDLQPNIDNMRNKVIRAGVVLLVLLSLIVAATIYLTRTLSAPIAELLAKLGTINNQLEHQIRAKSFIAELAQQLQGAQSAEQCGSILLSRLHERCNVTQGMLSILTGVNRISVVCRFGAPTSEHCTQHYDFGQGIVGQCAKDRTPIALNFPTDSEWRIRSGLGEAQPRQILVFPVEHGGALKGVLEIGLLETATAETTTLLEEALTILGVSLHSFAYRHTPT